MHPNNKIALWIIVPICRKVDIELELARMKESVKKTVGQEEKIQFRELLKGSVWKPFVISVLLMFFQQFTVH